MSACTQTTVAPRSKGAHALSDQWRHFMSPTWRPVRVGLAALVAVQVLGLNVWAWHQQHTLKSRQAQRVQLLQQAHPQVRVVLDAPVQMQRETEALRLAAGVPGERDLESLLSVVARAWPDDRVVPAWRYDASGLTVALPATWGGGERDGFLQRVVRAGLTVQDLGDGRVQIQAPARAASDKGPA